MSIRDAAVIVGLLIPAVCVAVPAAAGYAGSWWAPPILVASLLAAARVLRRDARIRPRPSAGPLHAVALVTTTAVVAAVIGAHTVPGVGAFAVVLAVLAVIAGTRIRGMLGWLGVCGGALVILLAVSVCFAIAPVTSAPSSGFSPLGIVPAVLVSYLGFRGVVLAELSRRGLRVLAVLVVAAVYLLVAGAIVYQLGAPRAALSATPLLDAVSAADAVVVRPLLAGAVVLAAFPVLLTLITQARRTMLDATGGRWGREVTGARAKPYRLDLALGVVAAVLAVAVDLSWLAVAAGVLLVLVDLFELVSQRSFRSARKSHPVQRPAR